MITLGAIYDLAGLMYLAFAVLSLRDGANPRRWRNAAFYALLTVSFLAGGLIGDLANGVLVLALALVGGFGGLGQGAPPTTSPAERGALAARFGDRLFIPALVIPAVTLTGTLLAKARISGHLILGTEQTAVVALGVAIVIALIVGMGLLRPRLLAPLEEGRRMMDAVGWSGILPQLLAALGAVFALAGVGKVVGGLVSGAVPMNGPLIAVTVYCVGMAAFTVIMGNAFAAFPVMTTGVGLPFVVMTFGGDPAVVCAIGMLAGFCGTLVTPMAANFNVVPASLLDLPDKDRAFNGVIRVQAPTAALLLVANIVLMDLLAFRH